MTFPQIEYTPGLILGLMPLVIGMAGDYDSTWIRSFLNGIESDVKGIKADHEEIRQELRDKVNKTDVDLSIARQQKECSSEYITKGDLKDMKADLVGQSKTDRAIMLVILAGIVAMFFK